MFGYDWAKQYALSLIRCSLHVPCAAPLEISSRFVDDGLMRIGYLFLSLPDDAAEQLIHLGGQIGQIGATLAVMHHARQ